MKPEVDGGPAFPHDTYVKAGENIHVAERSFGMTLRDWFAGQALGGAVASGNFDSVLAAAEWSYSYADAMLKERSK